MVCYTILGGDRYAELILEWVYRTKNKPFLFYILLENPPESTL